MVANFISVIPDLKKPGEFIIAKSDHPFIPVELVDFGSISRLPQEIYGTKFGYGFFVADANGGAAEELIDTCKNAIWHAVADELHILSKVLKALPRPEKK